MPLCWLSSWSLIRSSFNIYLPSINILVTHIVTQQSSLEEKVLKQNKPIKNRLERTDNDSTRSTTASSLNFPAILISTYPTVNLPPLQYCPRTYLFPSHTLNEQICSIHITENWLLLSSQENQLKEGICPLRLRSNY